MTLLRPFALVVVVTALLVSGCADDGDDEAAGTTAATTTTAADTSETGISTPSEVKTAVFERSYSECGSFSRARLAAKYRVPRNATTIANAVARAWTEQFRAGDDAIPAGRDGCLQAIRDAD